MASAGAIYDPQSFQRCTLSGLSTMKGRLVKLGELKRGLETSMREVDGARTQMEVASAVLFGLKLVKASCDAFIGIGGELGGRPLKVVSGVYKAATPFAENTGKLIGGQRVGAGDWVKAATGGISAATGIVKGGPIADLVELKKIQSDIIVDAVNGDTKSVLKGVFVDYLGKVTTMSFEYLGREATAKYVNVGREIAETGYKLAEAYEEYRGNSDTTMYDGSKRLFQSQLFKAQRQIDNLQSWVTSCEAQLSAQPRLP